MKNWCTIALLIFCGNAVVAQSTGSLSGRNNNNTPVSLVPVKVHQKFILENPEVKARWKTESGVYTAQYINPLNNMGYMIVYDSLGNVLRREKELENQDYPPSINDFFMKEFPGEGYVIWSSVDSEGKQMYYTDHNSKLYTFDKNGKLLNPPRSNRGLDSVTVPVPGE